MSVPATKQPWHFQQGNQFGKSARDYEAGLKRALARIGKGSYADGINRVANRLVRAALKGQPWAIQEIGNRLDGKPTERVEVNNPGELSARDLLDLLAYIRQLQADRAGQALPAIDGVAKAVTGSASVPASEPAAISPPVPSKTP